ncbi:unnamed protein product [Adineta steineri]|uniref:F-box domain-containing protein n=1 Tax=Adineta steineri TaxID=433720 RepID=A0A813SB83_9BILA|nr:unnamed protein product [Adineta steineri]
MNRNGCTNFEELSNEIIYEIFDFLDTYQAYEIFSNLNIRFRNLLTLSDLSINVNIFNISKLSFEQHYEQFFKYNTHRIHSLYISNPIVIDLIFASIKNDILLTRLRILCLKNIDLNDCKDFFDYLVLLPQLSTLIIYSYKKDCDRIIIYDKLFRLPALKYCKLSLNDSSNFPWEVFSTAYDTVSPIEHLIIDCNVYFNELLHILPYVPHLRRLSIKSLTSSYGQVPHKFSFTLNNLTHVSIELHLINFDQFQPFMTNLFKNLQVLYISTIATILSLCDVVSEAIYDFYLYAAFFSYFMLPLFPFVCALSLPELRSKLINILHLRRPARRIGVETLAMRTAMNRQMRDR